jgi:hypothetical protein
MKLKINTNFADFLLSVQSCKNDVYFNSADGDQLNLKSLLSQYIFTSVEANHQLIKTGEIVCKNEQDYELLSKYLE